MSETGSGSTRTVERALALLAEVCDHERVSLAECARNTQLPASTALRLLRTLEARNFIRRDVDGSFQAGPRMIQLGAMTFGRQSLASMAQPALRRIADEFGETTYLLIAGPPGSALTIAMAEGTHAVRHASWVGHRIPARGCAVALSLSGRVGPDGFVSRPAPGEPDVTAVAAPILRPPASTASAASLRGRAGRVPSVAGVISVVGPTYRLDERQVRLIGSTVSRECLRLASSFEAATASSTPGDPLGGRSALSDHAVPHDAEMRTG